eukprot:COSAG01_NODE_6690_length_3541_cov_2.209471_4_plen_92_part_00
MFVRGTDAFFPPSHCVHGVGLTNTVLRLLVAGVTAPAGVIMSLVFDMLFLSQFFAVEYAKQVTLCSWQSISQRVYSYLFGLRQATGDLDCR